MFRILFALSLFSCLGASAQEFRFESRFHLLQPYIRQHAIKSITLGKSTDSLEAFNVDGLHLEFDELGRLTLIDEPRSVEKLHTVVYTYTDQDRMYATKHYYWRNAVSGE